MKRLTLNQTWIQCLKMWKWIAKEKRQGNTRSVSGLKCDWLEAHGYDADEEEAVMGIMDTCFFCEYVIKRGLECNNCPGAKIDKEFECGNDDYNWFSNPIAFYAELQRLHKIYKRKKK